MSHWSSGRRVLAPAALIALIAAVSGSALMASASDDSSKAVTPRAAAPKPTYFLPVGTLVSSGKLPKPTMAGDAGKVGVPNNTPPVPTQPDQSIVTNQGQAIAGYQGGAGTLTPAGIATLALQTGCTTASAVTATAIAMAESGGSPSAQGDIALMTPVWDWSAGLWQIRGLRSERNTGGLRDSIANQGAAKNASAMNTISSGCTNWTPWSTYNSGAYLRYVTIAGQAVNYVARYYNAHGHQFPTVAGPDPTAVIPAQSADGGGLPASVAGVGSGASATATPTKHAKHRSATSKKSRGHHGASRPAPTSGSAPSSSSAPTAHSGTPKLPKAPKPTKLPVKLPTSKPKLPIPVPTTKIPTKLPVTVPPVHLPVP